jgi:hypothetical protein
VNRRGATAPADPGNCYDPVNVDGAGGLWVPKTGYIGAYSGADSGLKQIPVESGTSTPFDEGGFGSGPCPERWIGHFQIQHNIQADAGNPYVHSLMNFRLQYIGIISSDINTRNTISFQSAGGRQQTNDFIWVPFQLEVPALTAVTFRFTGTSIINDNVDGGSPTSDNSFLIQGLRIARFAA